MTRITLTPEQASMATISAGPIQLCDADGNVIFTFQPEQAPEFIAEMKRRAASPGPWFTGAQVQARLKALDAERERIGGFDRAYMLAFLERLNEADPGFFVPGRTAQ